MGGRNPETGSRSNWTDRNTSDETGKLDLHDLRKLINSHAFASYVGKPLTAHVTVRWHDHAAFHVDDWLTHQGRFLDRVTRWCIRRDIPPAFIWTRENGATLGPHTHVLIHLPNYPEQRPALCDFITTTMFPDTAPSSPTQPVRITGGSFGMHTRPMQVGSLKYLLKGLPAAMTHRTATADGYLVRHVPTVLGINPDHDAPPIAGLRAAASHSIGASARRAAGWRELHDLDALRRYLTP